MIKKEFYKILLTWDAQFNTRQMPWKGEKDPYKIWLSEIILQQTRVDQGTKYYERFIKHYPTVQDLAIARDQQVFKLWEGLGYYTRCRNLISTARYITRECKGVFPKNYEEILALKGIGPYTAAAIASFAYNLPYPVIDGNVFRVLARIFGIQLPTDTTEGKTYFKKLAGELLDKKNAGKYNQAIMDFGAIICKPQLPLCNTCLFQQHCIAYRKNKILDLPLKSKKLLMRHRYFIFYVFETHRHILITQRSEDDVWPGLYQFPLIELPVAADLKEPIRLIKKRKDWKCTVGENTHLLKTYKQQLSHQVIHGTFIHVPVKNKQQAMIPGSQWVLKTSLADYPFPQIIHQYLNEKMDNKKEIANN